MTKHGQFPRGLNENCPRCKSQRDIPVKLQVEPRPVTLYVFCSECGFEQPEEEYSSAVTQETPRWAKVALWALLLIPLAMFGTLGQHLGELFPGFANSKVPLSDQKFSTEEVAELTALMATSSFPPGTVVAENLLSEGASADGPHITYSYRFQIAQDLVDPDWIAEMSSGLPTAYCQKMEDLAKMGISAEWRYIDIDGNPVFSVKAEPEDCQLDQ